MGSWPPALPGKGALPKTLPGRISGSGAGDALGCQSCASFVEVLEGIGAQASQQLEQGVGAGGSGLGELLEEAAGHAEV